MTSITQLPSPSDPPNGGATDPIPPKPPLARSTLEAYGGIVAGAFGSVVTQWWAKTILLAVAALLLSQAIFRSKLTIGWWYSAKWVASISLVVILAFIAWEPIAEDFHKKHPGAQIPWFTPYEEPTEFALPGPNDPVQSIYARISYFCKMRRLNQTEMEAFKQDRRAFAEALGYSIEFSDLPDGGLRFEMTAITAGTQLKMLVTKKISMEIRQVRGGVIITGTQDLEGIFKVLGMAPVDRDAENTKQSVETVVKFSGAGKGKCYVL
jgi:hypothetical protein